MARTAKQRAASIRNLKIARLAKKGQSKGSAARKKAFEAGSKKRVAALRKAQKARKW